MGVIIFHMPNFYFLLFLPFMVYLSVGLSHHFLALCFSYLQPLFHIFATFMRYRVFAHRADHPICAWSDTGKPHKYEHEAHKLLQSGAHETDQLNVAEQIRESLPGTEDILVQYLSGYLVDETSKDEDILQVAHYMLEFVAMDEPDILEHLMAAFSALLQVQLTRRENAQTGPKCISTKYST
jgi:hypothetical protein